MRIRNLSTSGALLEGGDFPGEGKKAQLRRGSLCVPGEIAWQNGKFCGLRFDHAILVQEWVKRGGSEAQMRVDATIAQFRGGMAGASLRAPVNRDTAVQNFASELLQICERVATLPNMTVSLAEEVMKIEALARSMEVASRRSASPSRSAR